MFSFSFFGSWRVSQESQFSERVSNASCFSGFVSNLDRSILLGMSLKKEADEMLFLELALRGYDLSRLLDEDVTGEVVKIG